MPKLSTIARARNHATIITATNRPPAIQRSIRTSAHEQERAEAEG
jgi:hypothetical protein